MYINNWDIKIYNAKLLERSISPSSFEIEKSWSKNSLTPLINKDIKRRYKDLTLTVEFKGTAAEIEKDKSRFIKDISISTIQFKTLKNNYIGSVTQIREGRKFRGFETLEVSMEVIEEEPEQKIDLNGETTLFVDGNTETPCILEFTPTQNLVNVTITGLGEDITINNLTKDKTVVIDGEKGLVLEEGENKWTDYDSWSFPKLNPGENNITINKASIDAKLSYKARWI